MHPMTQAYSDPARASDPHALPDIQVFFISERDIGRDRLASRAAGIQPYWERFATGWYWWACFPGCLPDSEPVGPFNTEAEALADAQGPVA